MAVIAQLPKVCDFSHHTSTFLMFSRIWEAQKERWHILVRKEYYQRLPTTDGIRH
jgi:hypothetical protein